MLPKRISNPFMNKLLSSTLIHALRCPLPQPPQDLLVCLRRFPFLHNFLDVSTDTLSTSFFCLLLMVFSLTSRLTYIFILIVSSHIHCLLCFSPSHPHRYVLCLYIDVFKPSLHILHFIGSKFCLPSVVLFTPYIVVVLCTVRTVRFP